jgi:hypothetical protein
MINSKDEIFERIFESVIRFGKPIAFEFEDLRFAFGFKRMSGESILLTQLISNKSEMEIQLAPNYQIMQNIERWCKENGIQYHYDLMKNYYIFGRTTPIA